MEAILFPGQGSQYRGMGKNIFPKYKNEVQRASDILGYDLEKLCLRDPNRELKKTQFTQPALFVVNALTFLDQKDRQRADYFVGHSLGEYNALYAAGAFDFETGVRLVQKRGALMAAASGGGMAAVLGIDSDRLKDLLAAGGHEEIDVANFNTPSQIVVAGPTSAINNICDDFNEQGIRIIPLNVTAPFHSRYMKVAAEEFSSFLKEFEFSPLNTPVVANVSSRPYTDDRIAELLSLQIASPVKWTDTIRFLMGKEVADYHEIGAEILTKMVKEIKTKCEPIIEQREKVVTKEKQNGTLPLLEKSSNGKRQSTALGSQAFRETYGVKYSYLVGSMYRGIASKELVVSVAKSNILSFLGAGGLSLKRIEEDIVFIKSQLTEGQRFGVNLLHNLEDKNMEMETVKLFLRHQIRNVEASAFMQVTLALVYYRLKGLRKNEDESVACDHKIIAKVSRPEVAESFMQPAPERLVNKLLDQGLITSEEAALSKLVPMSYDICVEADSGGHTDGGVALVLLPSIQSLRKSLQKQYNYPEQLRVGLAGGIGTPQAIACAFVMGADFVLTGSINQCTVESGTSSTVKDLLQDIDVQDTGYAPAGDMFEIGAKIQVLKKGVLFPARANKLYTLYQQYDSIEDIPEKVRQKIEKSYFKKSIEEVWSETKTYLKGKGMESDITEAEEVPKKKMGLIFRWYFGYTNRLSFQGDAKEKVNFQIHTGPALGAFNQWVKGTELENWRNRHAAKIGVMMMEQAAELMDNI